MVKVESKGWNKARTKKRIKITDTTGKVKYLTVIPDLLPYISKARNIEEAIKIAKNGIPEKASVKKSIKEKISKTKKEVAKVSGDIETIVSSLHLVREEEEEAFLLDLVGKVRKAGWFRRIPEKEFAPLITFTDTYENIFLEFNLEEKAITCRHKTLVERGRSLQEYRTCIEARIKVKGKKLILTSIVVNKDYKRIKDALVQILKLVRFFGDVKTEVSKNFIVSIFSSTEYSYFSSTKELQKDIFKLVAKEFSVSLGYFKAYQVLYG